MNGHTSSLRFRIPPPFEFRLAVKGHGWFDLAPLVWNEGDDSLDTVVLLDDQAVDLSMRGSSDGFKVAVRAARPLDRAAVRRLRGMIARMFRLDEDFGPFWKVCRGHPDLRWVARHGAGRLLRSGSLFEDLMKLLFTTNCSWGLTRALSANLVAAAGTEAPSGRRAFPSPEQLADRDETFYRDVVRTGYRAGAARELVARFLDGRLVPERLESMTDPGPLREELLRLRGFGPYAAGQAARLLGAYEDLALDSWCRARLAEMDGRSKPPSDRAIARRYAAFGPWAGLALWMDLTRDWHPSIGTRT